MNIIVFWAKSESKVGRIFPVKILFGGWRREARMMYWTKEKINCYNKSWEDADKEKWNMADEYLKFTFDDN